MDPTRFAGQSFADAAASLMFDPHGRLVAEPNLATAQALCLLQSHDYVTAKEGPASRYHGECYMRRLWISAKFKLLLLRCSNPGIGNHGCPYTG